MELNKLTTKIKDITLKADKSALEIAYYMHVIERDKLYAGDYKNIVEYAKNELDYKRTTTYNLITIGEEYVTEEVDAKGRTRITCTLGDYGISQITALLPLGYDKAADMIKAGNITNTMSVRDIKQIVKSHMAIVQKPDSDEGMQVIDAPESQEPVEAPESQEPVEAPESHEPVEAPESQEPVEAPSSVVSGNATCIYAYTIDNGDMYYRDTDGSMYRIKLSDLQAVRESVSQLW